jgi:hypothetical protein
MSDIDVEDFEGLEEEFFPSTVEDSPHIQLNFYFNREKQLFIVPNVDDVDTVDLDELKKLINKHSYSYVNDVGTDINYLHFGGNKKIKRESSTKIRKSFKHIRNLIRKK